MYNIFTYVYICICFNPMNKQFWNTKMFYSFGFFSWLIFWVPIKGKGNLHSPPYPLSSYLQLTDFHKKSYSCFFLSFCGLGTKVLNKINYAS